MDERQIVCTVFRKARFLPSLPYSCLWVSNYIEPQLCLPRSCCEQRGGRGGGRTEGWWASSVSARVRSTPKPQMAVGLRIIHSCWWHRKSRRYDMNQLPNACAHTQPPHHHQQLFKQI